MKKTVEQLYKEFNAELKKRGCDYLVVISDPDDNALNHHHYAIHGNGAHIGHAIAKCMLDSDEIIESFSHVIEITNKHLAMYASEVIRELEKK